ncbi:RloB family protein [Buttiauxella ferragutiae ATCC 51602]|uniref:RloB family protein n=1 Tax=Buttiauxella ferragutiae ATCC 51602 TaxID=1354252 RepID=A0ABX2W5Q8_9ENTR|nr:RloB domain-containing protein [Buttiauxella ferragutiae]OAT26191.1 RloB family protein [Buttiauxella ferragutiae ATCC 51602]
MAKVRQVRVTKETLLFVGEGFCEKAFLAHINGLYSKGAIKTKIITAKGKGPEHVINHAISCKKIDGYDHVAVLLDLDLICAPSVLKDAKAKGIIIIGSEPCLEGFLLDIMGVKKCTTNNGCKKICHPLLNGEPTDRDTYSALFKKSVLDKARKIHENLNSIINLFEGKLK